MKLRRAEHTDYLNLLPLVQAMCEHYIKLKEEAPSLNLQKAFVSFYEFFSRDDSVAFLVEDGDKPVAFMIAQVTGYMMSDDVYALEKAFYVSPEARNGKALILLWNALETWAKEKGCHCVKLNVVGSRDNKTLLRWTERRGYKLTGFGAVKLL